MTHEKRSKASWNAADELLRSLIAKMNKVGLKINMGFAMGTDS